MASRLERCTQLQSLILNFSGKVMVEAHDMFLFLDFVSRPFPFYAWGMTLNTPTIEKIDSLAPKHFQQKNGDSGEKHDSKQPENRSPTIYWTNMLSMDTVGASGFGITGDEQCTGLLKPK